MKIIQIPIQYEAQTFCPRRHWAGTPYDSAIIKLARKFKGAFEGCGMCMADGPSAGREHVFIFKTKPARAQFVKALAKATELRVSKVYLSDVDILNTGRAS